MSNDEMPDLRGLNETELLTIIRHQTKLVLRRSVPKERLVQIIEHGLQPAPEELAGTTGTRARLQIFVEKNWEWVNSQLPCKGENRGRCTIYPCPEARHLDCFMSSSNHAKV